MTPSETQKTHTFHVQTPNGPAQINVPIDEFKQCACGCTLFEIQNRVAWVRPHGLIGAPPMCFKAEIYCCIHCGTEVGPDSQTVKDARSAGNGEKKGVVTV